MIVDFKYKFVFRYVHKKNSLISNVLEWNNHATRRNAAKFSLIEARTKLIFARRNPAIQSDIKIVFKKQ